MTRPLAESSIFLWHYLADLDHNHLATLAVRKINSDCHVTMRNGWSIQRVKLETRMPCPHTLWSSRCWDVFFFNLGRRVLEMLRAPRYLNPALVLTYTRFNSATAASYVSQSSMYWYTAGVRKLTSRLPS